MIAPRAKPHCAAARRDDLRCLSTYATGEKALIGIPPQITDVALVDIHLSRHERHRMRRETPRG